jgi:hypothetical protein
MKPTRSPRARSHRLAWLLALLPAFAAAPIAQASSHREAPSIRNDPSADNTDVYLFRDPGDPSRVTMIGNWIPLQEPAGGPNYYNFNPMVRYELKFDNNGDAVEDITYRFTFVRNVRNPNTFLYNVGPVTSINDTDLNVYYTYDVDRVLGPSPDASGANVSRIGSGLLEAPYNNGPKTYANGYETVSNGAVYFEVDGNTRVFAGPRADPFYVDLGMTFDLINLQGRSQTPFGYGVNGLAGFNVQTIAISVPISRLTANGSVPTSTSDPNAIISGWAATYRQATTILGAAGQPPTATGSWVQVSRLANPLVNEVVVPIGTKDRFNATEPKDDAQYAAAVLDPEVPRLLTALFGIAVPPAPRNDLLALVQGVQGLTMRPGEVISDQLRLNVAVPVTPIASVNRLGVIGGDNAGFPNGRRIYDDVVDIELRVLAGVLASGFNVAPNNALGDNVNGPDMPFLQSFPWLATPHNGFDHKHDHPGDPRLRAFFPASTARPAQYGPDGKALPETPYEAPASLPVPDRVE